MIYEATLKAFVRGGEMAQSGKHLPCKNENLSLFLRIHVKTNKIEKQNKTKNIQKADVIVLIWNYSFVNVETHGLASLG